MICPRCGKLLAAVVVLMMAFAMLTACGDQPQTVTCEYSGVDSLEIVTVEKNLADHLTVEGNRVQVQLEDPGKYEATLITDEGYRFKVTITMDKDGSYSYDDDSNMQSAVSVE